MTAIRSKKDAKNFVDYADGFIFKDSRCNGLTRISNVNGWQEYSWGQNWSDQAPTYIDDIAEFLFRYRADINKQIKNNIKMEG